MVIWASHHAYSCLARLAIINHQMIKKIILLVLFLTLISSSSFVLAYFYFQKDNSPLKSTISTKKVEQKELPLLQYSIPALSKREFVAEQAIKVEKIISQNSADNSYVLLFTYLSQGKKISGALNLKLDENQSSKPVIIMLRGWAPLESYYPGMGTKNAAAIFAQNGYLTLAPDFLGYGESDSEPNDTWETRFVKVANVIDLLRTIQKFPKLDLSQLEDFPIENITINQEKIGLWGHSNGGQIAVSTLEVLGSNLPTTLWAPVLAPFPYSILYFTDENQDEGKEARAYLSLFEKDYDVFDFSITQHLDRLQGPLQIQHGTSDDSALVTWSEEFLQKIDLENDRRRAINASQSATSSTQLREIKVDFYKYPGANHNLQPNWNQAVERDLSFFAKNLN